MADLPNRGDQIKYLKYIGPRFARRFRAENIRTLQDLVDEVGNQTRAQNTSQWQRILVNERTANNTKCVDHTSRHPTRPWQTAWPADRRPANPTGITVAQQAALDALQNRYYPNTDGEYQYCVRRYNKCAWESVRDYLLRKGPQGRQRRNFRARIPFSIERVNNDWCRTATVPWCLVPPASPPQSPSSSSSSAEDDDIDVPGINIRGLKIPGVRRRPTRIARRESPSSSSDAARSPQKRVTKKKQVIPPPIEKAKDIRKNRDLPPALPNPPPARVLRPPKKR